LEEIFFGADHVGGGFNGMKDSQERMKKYDNTEIIEINSITDFIRSTKLLPKKQWVFRGHANELWKIESTLSRFLRTHATNIKTSWHARRESQAISRFQKAAHDFLNHLPDDKNTLEWLAVMRHYGAPTRLIDFTYSPITALFFAAGDPFRDFSAPFVVHALNIKSVLSKTCSVLERGLDCRLSPSDFEILTTSQFTKNYVSFFEGRWNTPRQIAQQGLFMLTSTVAMDVEQFLGSCPLLKGKHNNNPWLCFRFNGGLKLHKEITNYLLDVNQTHATLYPGVEGLAQSLFMKFYEPSSVVERAWEP
jgi:hypothetical protein